MSSNLFYQGDAAMIIQDMVNAGYLEEVSFDTYMSNGREKILMKRGIITIKGSSMGVFFLNTLVPTTLSSSGTKLTEQVAQNRRPLGSR
ncbi:MAG: hypothetical protein WBF33_07460 [Candidatus Nitrosopolaris sp.]